MKSCSKILKEQTALLAQFLIVNDLCLYYGLDLDPEEVNAFSQLFKVGYQNIDLAFVLHSPDSRSRDFLGDGHPCFSIYSYEVQ